MAPQVFTPPKGLYRTISDVPSPILNSKQHGVDDFLSDDRTTTMVPAVFSLINTVVGGGVLSLSYSFQASGTIVGTIFLIVVCLATDFTLFSLISASRRTGAKSYEAVMFAAFGLPAQVLTILFIIIITFLTPVAYLILLRGLITPLVEAYITHYPLTSLHKDLIIGGIALLVTPITSFRSMGAIGSLAIFSMLSIVVLAAVVGIRSYECLLDRGTPDMPAVNPNHFQILSSVPVFVSCFLCHFNVLPVFSELRCPTRDRAHNMVHYTMFTTLVLYLWVGLMGYAYGKCRTGDVPDNLLLAFPADDPMVNVARGALMIVLCFCYPLLLIPCRDSLVRLVEVLALSPSSSSSSSSLATSRDNSNRGSEHGLEVAVPLLRDSSNGSSGATRLEEDDYGTLMEGHSREENNRGISPPSPPTTPLSTDSNGRKLFLTYIMTAIIIGIASTVKSVAIMWQVMGSFACIAVAFIFPTAAYLKVGCPQQRLKRIWGSVILGGGVLVMIACIVQTVYSLAL